MVLVLEIMTLSIKPLLTFRFMLVNRRSRTRQVLTGVVEIQNLLIDIRTKKISIGFGAIRNASDKCVWVQRPYVVDLTFHAIEKRLFTVLRCRP